MQNTEIKEGDNVSIIVSVWREDETPTIANFYNGKVIQIVERAANCLYLRVSGLDRLIPIDRARLS